MSWHALASFAVICCAAHTCMQLTAVKMQPSPTSRAMLGAVVTVVMSWTDCK